MSEGEGAGAETPSARRRRYLEYAGLWTLGIAVPAVVLAIAGLYNPGLEVSNSAPTILGIWAIFYPLFIYRLRLLRLPSFALIVGLSSFAVAAISVATGWGNGMTDEPYAMPGFLQPLLHGYNPYSTPITVTYNQYGTVFHLGPITYIYLPLLIFLQPFYGGGTGYKVYTVLCWAAVVVLVRKDPFAVVAVGQPYMALLAASGFNDFPVLLLLTVAFVGIQGKRQKWAEYLALGCKQFASVFVVAYYALQRDWRNLTIAIVVSLAWVLPFLIWDPSAFICQAVLFSPSGCSGSSAGGVLTHLNYWAWPVWVLAVFFVPLRAYYHRLLQRARGGSRPAEPAEGRPGAEPPPVPVAPANSDSSGGPTGAATRPPERDARRPQRVGIAAAPPDTAG